jgi:predicted N-formylglutamate amidohydrolase
VTRLLVDVNRSIGHRRLFSEFSRGLSHSDRERALERHYFPYRRGVEDAVGRAVALGTRVIHISVHSFTPRLNGEVRSAEIGLLYDPRRLAEREFCARWRNELVTQIAASPRRVDKLKSDWMIRRNYPYRGASDGLTTALRQAFPSGAYLGIELEVNQALLMDRTARKRAATLVARSLHEALAFASATNPPRLDGHTELD